MDPMKPFEIPTDMRKFAEQSVDQARKAFDSYITAAHQAVSEMEGRAQAARSGVMDMSGRAMTFAERNMAEGFEFAKSLVHAKDVEELLKLQTDFVKKQIATLQEQAKELSETATRAAKDAAARKP